MNLWALTIVVALGAVLIKCGALSVWFTLSQLALNLGTLVVAGVVLALVLRSLFNAWQNSVVQRAGQTHTK